MRLIRLGLLAAFLALIGWAITARVTRPDGAGGPSAEDAAVRVADVVRGPIELRRTFSGTLEARAEFPVATRVGGRVERVLVDLADRVRNGQVVARLDDDEFRQAVAQAEAEHAVAEARIVDTESALEIARREFDRVTSLAERGIASPSQTDAARADLTASEGDLAVARAQLVRAEAALESARIRLGYTSVRVSWSDSDEERTVADRFVDDGATVTANTELLSIVSLDPITAVVFVPERDYASLAPGRPVTLRTDAHGERRFEGKVERIAPVFRRESRQARVEMTIDNADQALKPGMFARVEALLDRADDATIVPLDALATRNGTQGVFVLDEDGASVSWRPVRPGIRQEDRVQVIGEGVTGKVVTLGQQLIGDGSRVSVAGAAP